MNANHAVKLRVRLGLEAFQSKWGMGISDMKWSCDEVSLLKEAVCGGLRAFFLQAV